MKWIPIIDPAVSASEPRGQYPPYDDGEKLDIFIKDRSTNEPFLGKVWNTATSVWPDFTNPKSTIYWSKQFSDFYKLLPFDGAWIDMNEPSNVYDGISGGCGQGDLENPPYVPGRHRPNQFLQLRTLCMSAKHHLGDHYDLHNMYAIYEAKATREALISIKPDHRPFIISRATSTGFGHYASHWTGDVYSTWEAMKYSIPSLLNFNMVGIPLVGADICGFNGNTTHELCARWSSLGAFYPFSRNHNTIDTIDQDPGYMGGDVVSAARRSLRLRYSLLPTLYTLFYEASAVGATVMRPLMSVFPTDPIAYEVEDQFMWGSTVLISPVLVKGDIEVRAYFPAGRWYSYENRTELSGLNENQGQWLVLDMPIDEIGVHLRGGSIVAVQEPAMTTTDQQTNPIELLVALDNHHEAQGQLFWDDGQSVYDVLKMEFSLIKFDCVHNELVTKPLVSNYKPKTFVFGNITVMGLETQPTSLKVNEEVVSDFSIDSIGNLLIHVELDPNVKNVISWT